MITMTTPVTVQRIGPGGGRDALAADIERVRILATALDSQFEIAGFRFGWDAIIGLVPVAGDVVTGLLGIYPIIVARKHGLSRFVKGRMITNLLLDWAVGAVPLAGDVFDVAFKANMKNLKLLERELEKRRSGP
jgi:hypothetical protein